MGFYPCGHFPWRRRAYDGVGSHAQRVALELHGADVHAAGGYHRLGVVGMEDDAQAITLPPLISQTPPLSLP